MNRTFITTFAAVSYTHLLQRLNVNKHYEYNNLGNRIFL